MLVQVTQAAYSEREMRSCIAQFLSMDANRELAIDLASAWRSRRTGARRFAKVYEDDRLTLWLLGWRPGEDVADHLADTTPIHGHGDSAVYVSCLEGEVDNDNYGLLPQDAQIGTQAQAPFRPSTLSLGETLYLPVGGVHDMRCDEKDGRGFALTLHAYSPRLSTMTFYESTQQGGEVSLRLADVWHDTPQLIRPRVHVVTPPFSEAA
jgi:Cysteine dioxygenase type I